MPSRSAKKIALVTGANRGIGLEICRQLAQHDVHVVMTSRDKAKGEEACHRLQKDGLLDVVFHPLDVTDSRSIRRASAFLEKQYGGLDILVNNAGVMLDPKCAKVLSSDPQTFRNTMETNVYGPLQLCQACIPLMQKKGGGRIVNLASGLGQLSDMGTGTPAYRMSKTSLNALTRMLAAELAGTEILVNSMCPGWVRTDMGGPNAARSVEEGAETAVWLALLPDNGPTGGFFRDRKPIPW